MELFLLNLWMVIVGVFVGVFILYFVFDYFSEEWKFFVREIWWFLVGMFLMCGMDFVF